MHQIMKCKKYCLIVSDKKLFTGPLFFFHFSILVNSQEIFPIIFFLKMVSQTLTKGLVKGEGGEKRTIFTILLLGKLFFALLFLVDYFRGFLTKCWCFQDFGKGSVGMGKNIIIPAIFNAQFDDIFIG